MNVPSPHLFILTLEPLLNSIRMNPHITDINSTSSHYKIAAYADDVLLFLSNPLISLPNLQKELKLFQYITNFKINRTKFEALNISLPGPLVEQFKQSFPYDSETDSITYLGIEIPTNLCDILKKSYLSMSQSIFQDLRKWNKAHFS